MSEAVSPTALAIVMTGGDALPGNDALARAIRARLPQANLLQEAGAQGGGSLLFLHDGYMCAIGKIAAPCPISGDEPCVTFAWHWPDAAAQIKKHKNHLLVSVTGGADAKRRAGLHGQLVAAAIEAATDPIAAHWANSDALWPARLVVQAIRAGDEQPPVPLCVGVKLMRDADGAVSAATRGLAAFGLMEIETSGFSGDPRALSGVLLNLAGYLIDAGAAIKDGDTIGPDAATKIMVRHEESAAVAGRKVYRLYFNTKGGA